MSSSSSEIPARFLCPISREPMQDPVRISVERRSVITDVYTEGASIRACKQLDYVPLSLGLGRRDAGDIYGHTRYDLGRRIADWCRENGRARPHPLSMRNALLLVGERRDLEGGPRNSSQAPTANADQPSTLSDHPPHRFLCPMSARIMSDPVTIDGTESNVERTAIEACVPTDYIPRFLYTGFARAITWSTNNELKRSIDEWCSGRRRAPPPPSPPDQVFTTRTSRDGSPRDIYLTVQSDPLPPSTSPIIKHPPMHPSASSAQYPESYFAIPSPSPGPGPTPRGLASKPACRWATFPAFFTPAWPVASPGPPTMSSKAPSPPGAMPEASTPLPSAQLQLVGSWTRKRLVAADGSKWKGTFGSGEGSDQ